MAGLAIFVATYALIATERIHKTIAAMAGGMAMILVGIVSQEEAFEHIDFNVIFLLAGMMILAGIIRKTGVFGWLAVRAARFAGGDAYRMLVVMSIITAVASAFLDNVTTVVLVGPITLFLAARLGINPMPFLISRDPGQQHRRHRDADRRPAEHPDRQRGGTSTSPPSLLNMAPLAVIMLVIFLVAARWIFRCQLTSTRRCATRCCRSTSAR